MQRFASRTLAHHFSLPSVPLGTTRRVSQGMRGAGGGGLGGCFGFGGGGGGPAYGSPHAVCTTGYINICGRQMCEQGQGYALAMKNVGSLRDSAENLSQKWHARHRQRWQTSKALSSGHALATHIRADVSNAWNGLHWSASLGLMGGMVTPLQPSHCLHPHWLQWSFFVSETWHHCMQRSLM